MPRPGETVEEWKARMASSAHGAAPAYVWCPWCRQRARGFRRDGKYIAYCSRCGKTWRRHKGVPA